MLTPFDVYKRVTQSQPNGGAGNPVYSNWFRELKHEFLKHFPEVDRTGPADGTHIVHTADIAKLHNWIEEKFAQELAKIA